MRNTNRNARAGGTQAGRGRAGDRARPPTNRTRAPAHELFTAAAELVSSGAAATVNTARRYSLCPADAEDAHQRGLEILMTKAPVTDRTELQRWLHTVVKHEALAIRRQRERLLGSNGDEASETVPSSAPGPDDGAAGRERALRTAEALMQLKSSETQCLLLGALGYSYDEISARTGFSWTKVNRSMTEGRKRFFDLFSEIEAGRYCRRLGPLLASVCDGETTTRERLRVRAHLHGCPSCRAALRAHRAAAGNVGALLPPAVLLPGLGNGGWLSRLHDLIATTIGERIATLAHKLQQAGELIGAQKTAAVVASTAALTGGAVVSEHSSRERVGERHAAAARVADARATAYRAAEPAADQPPPAVPRAPEQAPPGNRPQSGDPTGAVVPAAEFVPERAEAAPASTGPPATGATNRLGKGETSRPVPGPPGPAPAPEFSP